jgi:hypothetical protein
MDGVIVNFVRGALDYFKSSLDIAECRWNFPGQMGYAGGNDPKFWEPLGYDFWANLPWTAEGPSLIKQLEEMVGQKNIGLLTSPCDTDGCVEGKRTWVKNNLPAYKRQLIVTPAKNLFAAPKKILVDDHDPNVEGFRSAGGNAVLVPRPWNCEMHLTDGKGGCNVTQVVNRVRDTIHKIV